ncbi:MULTISPECIES: hypothetical protein [unclassified Solwaraspora]|uniref:hypothetical protein n=1 Tax=unclassified Solwaraspora TaxID=2627926 RepID=UPI00248B6B5A|nr:MULTISPECIES: hypothetical protein [unclassified Solwaraspora]WBB99827.1 hypothetical protein O7553_13540 [Solwaraspora sp. WMMA2059]WBC21625.1 hypothetical protein O7543_03830 [Solwaraspora sp. WMMA2080]WJK36316.1 hypothetical protein O7610_08190 [Solwaraspora sp. WMMA2065]
MTTGRRSVGGQGRRGPGHRADAGGDGSVGASQAARPLPPVEFHVTVRVVLRRRGAWLLLGVAICRLADAPLDAVTAVAGTIQMLLSG